MEKIKKFIATLTYDTDEASANEIEEKEQEVRKNNMIQYSLCLPEYLDFTWMDIEEVKDYFKCLLEFIEQHEHEEFATTTFPKLKIFKKNDIDLAKKFLERNQS